MAFYMKDGFQRRIFDNWNNGKISRERKER